MEHSAIARREFFYVGGEYAGAPGQEVMHGQMYVEKLIPLRAAMALSAGAGVPRRRADRDELASADARRPLPAEGRVFRR